MRVVRQHFRRYVTRNRHHGLVAGLRLGKFSNRMVVISIVEAEFDCRALDITNIGLTFLVLTRLAWVLQQTALRTLDRARKSTPGCTPAGLRACRVNLVVLASREWL